MEKNVMQATKNTLTAIKNNRKEYAMNFWLILFSL
jgi:hypothetical protein